MMSNYCRPYRPPRASLRLGLQPQLDEPGKDDVQRPSFPAGLTLTAFVFPLLLSVPRSYITRKPSASKGAPGATALTWTNMSGPGSSGMMKPNPRSVLKNFTVPVGISIVPVMFQP